MLVIVFEITLQSPSIQSSLHVLARLHLQTGRLRPKSYLRQNQNPLKKFCDTWVNLKLAVKSLPSTGSPCNASQPEGLSRVWPGTHVFFFAFYGSQVTKMNIDDWVFNFQCRQVEKSLMLKNNCAPCNEPPFAMMAATLASPVAQIRSRREDKSRPWSIHIITKNESHSYQVPEQFSFFSYWRPILIHRWRT